MSSTQIPPLPNDSENQSFVTVKALLTCFIHLPFNLVFQDSVNYPDSTGSYVPVFNFLIAHPTRGLALFDLGVRKHAEGYPPGIARVRASRAAETAHSDVADLLREQGVKPEDIQHVIMSHLHWDHIGDPAPFTSADIVVGAEARAALAEDVYPANPGGTILQFPPDRPITFVDWGEDALRQTILSPFASFERAVDFHGDGSLYLVDAPGHFRGHLAAVARVAPGRFVFLGGDTCHNPQCYVSGRRLTGERIHHDVGRARETIGRLRRLSEEVDEVVVVLAHEAERLEEGMPLFPEDLREWVVSRVEKRKAVRRSM
ncbi:beta-lactamase-like protein [Cytidiella melzeri]|nr:beta-lactamase-like protein [Cytidiella melzeri]